VDKNHIKRHNAVGVLSILASSHAGVEYIAQKGMEDILKKLVGMMQMLDKDTVTIRLILTVLQKITLDSAAACEFLVREEFIDVLILVIEGSYLKFSINYGTSILANLFQNSAVLTYLGEKEGAIQSIGNIVLAWLNPEFPALPYLSTALQFLGADLDLMKSLKETGFQEKITEFVAKYRKLPLDNQAEKDAVIGMLETALKRERPSASAQYGTVTFETFPDEVQYLAST
jgi:hypothetical protein